MEKFPLIWAALSLPLMAAFFAIYAATRPLGVSLWRSAAKCGATFVAVATAVLGAVLYGGGVAGWLLVLALALCCAADFLIERSFAAGVAVFGLAHAAFIAYILGAARPVWASLPLGLALFLAAGILFYRELRTLGGKGAALLLYPAVLAAMTALAAALPFTAGPRYGVFALGAAAFAVSDVFVAKDALSGATDRQRNGALLLYYLAVYAMAFVQLSSA